MSKLVKLMDELSKLNAKRLALYAKRRKAQSAQSRARELLKGSGTRDEWTAKCKAYTKARSKPECKWTLEMEAELIQVRLAKIAKSKQVVMELAKHGMVAIWGTSDNIIGVETKVLRAKRMKQRKKLDKRYKREDAIRKLEMVCQKLDI
jgi:hypothetical protein